jgi:hypothetical protein
MSTKPDRPDRPPNAEQAQQRLEAHLQALRDKTARRGLSAPTAQFLDHIQATTQRYGPHLFTCFDDPSIPATTNMLEGFNGQGKRIIRKAGGTKSTANSPVHNLDVEFLLALNQVHQARAAQPRRAKPTGGIPVSTGSPAAPKSVQQPPRRATGQPSEETMPAPAQPRHALIPSVGMDIDIRRFKEVRSKIKEGEQPAQQNRSYVRKLKTNLERVGGMFLRLMGL